MANIMLTDRCNLQCSYCFANEFVNHSKNDISPENLKTALDFIATGRNGKLGLIGGEPTLHPQFKEILQFLIQDRRFQHVMVFTNGICIDQFVNELSHPKFRLLINCNSEEEIGIRNYQKLCNNLDLFIRDRYLKDRITLGYNIFKKNQDYEYILCLLKKYHYHDVRMAITVPNTDECRSINAMQYFAEIKPSFLGFLNAMMENNIVPYYDCNKMPACVLSDQEKQFLLQAFEQLDPVLKRDYMVKPDLSIFTNVVKCEPVIDIRQDLSAVRCFGMSSCTKTNISDFRTIDELRAYYNSSFDSYTHRTGISSKCLECYEKKVQNCTGGCYSYNIPHILKIKALIENNPVNENV